MIRSSRHTRADGYPQHQPHLAVNGFPIRLGMTVLRTPTEIK